MLKIGLTGGIGSGKTEVSNYFARLGAPVIDTDTIAHDLVQPGSSVLDEVVEVFGKSILDNKGQLDRKKLASLIFNSAEKKKQLEAILHPRITQTIAVCLESLEIQTPVPSYVIIVIPLLFEASLERLVDRILVVDTEITIQIERVKQRDRRPDNEIMKIIQTQVSREDRLQKADDIIKNTGSLVELHHQVDLLHQRYSVST